MASHCPRVLALPKNCGKGLLSIRRGKSPWRAERVPGRMVSRPFSCRDREHNAPCAPAAPRPPAARGRGARPMLSHRGSSAARTRPNGHRAPAQKVPVFESVRQSRADNTGARIAFACARASAVPQHAGDGAPINTRQPRTGRPRLRPSPRSPAAAVQRALRSRFASAVPQHAGGAARLPSDCSLSTFSLTVRIYERWKDLVCSVGRLRGDCGGRR
jgi:hypothetical protein